MKNVCQLSLGLIMSLASTWSLADQCAYVTKQQALDAAKLFKVGEKVIEFCEPCSSATKSTETITSIAVVPAGYKNFYELLVNGKSMDLAYTYIRTSSVVEANVASLVGCPAQDVSVFLKVTDKK